MCTLKFTEQRFKFNFLDKMEVSTRKKIGNKSLFHVVLSTHLFLSNGVNSKDTSFSNNPSF